MQEKRIPQTTKKILDFICNFSKFCRNNFLSKNKIIIIQNLAVGKAHPNLFELITVLKTIQETQQNELLLIGGGAKPPSKKLKYVKLNDKIRNLTNIFIMAPQQGLQARQPLLEFMDAVGYCMSGKV